MVNWLNLLFDFICPNTALTSMGRLFLRYNPFSLLSFSLACFFNSLRRWFNFYFTIALCLVTKTSQWTPFTVFCLIVMDDSFISIGWNSFSCASIFYMLTHILLDYRIDCLFLKFYSFIFHHFIIFFTSIASIRHYFLTLGWILILETIEVSFQGSSISCCLVNSAMCEKLIFCADFCIICRLELTILHVVILEAHK